VIRFQKGYPRIITCIFTNFSKFVGFRRYVKFCFPVGVSQKLSDFFRGYGCRQFIGVTTGGGAGIGLREIVAVMSVKMGIVGMVQRWAELMLLFWRRVNALVPDVDIIFGN
jgi:hypothetical protein